MLKSKTSLPYRRPALVAACLWVLALLLRAAIVTLTWTHKRIQCGPSARLWLASDDQVIAEFTSRGLGAVGKRMTATAVEPVCDDDTATAIKAVAKLQQIPPKDATDMVAKARRELLRSGSRPTTENMVALALKPAAA